MTNPTAEAERRQKRQREAEEAEEIEEIEEIEGADAGEETDEEEEAEEAADGAALSRVTRAQVSQARKEATDKRIAEMAAAMPQASVCIEMNATLWPGDEAEFTDGVQEVFLQEPEDPEDDVPLGVLLLPSCTDNGDWCEDACEVLQSYTRARFLWTPSLGMRLISPLKTQKPSS